MTGIDSRGVKIPGFCGSLSRHLAWNKCFSAILGINGRLQFAVIHSNVAAIDKVFGVIQSSCAEWGRLVLGWKILGPSESGRWDIYPWMK